MAGGAANFVVIGAGGLGCPALFGLRAAGVRSVVIVDPDRVEVSNLQRQVLYSVAEVGMPKAEAAALAMRRAVPSMRVIPLVRRIDPTDVPQFVAELPPGSIVLECSDSPPLKFAFNDACLAADVRLVIGAALGWSGQVIAIARGHACYRCIYEAPPPPELLPTCDVAGVVGPAVGHAGFVMADLAVRLRDLQPGAADALDETAGVLLAIDALRASVRRIAPRPRPDCPACRAEPKASPTATVRAVSTPA